MNKLLALAFVLALGAAALGGMVLSGLPTSAPAAARIGAPTPTAAPTASLVGIASSPGKATLAPFDLVRTAIVREGPYLVFIAHVRGRAGALKPRPTGKLGGSGVYSYVWPTTLDSSAVGFAPKQGILALAVTSHPDFDDTPLYHEAGDGAPHNAGALWHTHWIVLVPDNACGAGHLKVKDIPAGTKPRVPATWPGLPILIDSPGYVPLITTSTVQVRVPARDLVLPATFNYDGVTAGLRVNASVHDPLLCVTDVFAIASGNLSLPGRVR